jgi:hypothetical protein
MSHDQDKVVSGLICGNDLSKVREAVCIQVEKVYDSCKEKDCIEDAKVLFKNPHCVQKIINKAINVKIRKAEVVDVFADVEAVPFKRGFFTVDVKFFIRVTLDFFVSVNTTGPRIITKHGLVVFDKKVVLFGSEGSIKIFKTHFIEHECGEMRKASKLQQDNLPISKVEVAEPIGLNAKIQDITDKLFEDCCNEHMAIGAIGDTLGDDDEEDFEEDEDSEERHGHIPFRRVVVTIGLFSIVKLVRLVQLLIPAFDFCVPNKKCIASTEENPCELFESIEFPVDEFFPPQKFDFPGAIEHEMSMTGDPEE